MSVGGLRADAMQSVSDASKKCARHRGDPKSKRLDQDVDSRGSVREDSREGAFVERNGDRCSGSMEPRS